MKTLIWSLPVLSFIQLLSAASSVACGDTLAWRNPDDKTPVITLTAAIEKMGAERGVRIARSEVQAMCGTDEDFDVVDAATGRLLGQIPVPYLSEQKNDGRYVLVRAPQLLETPREQLLAIKAAAADFSEDVRGLEADLEVGAQIPDGLPLSLRTRAAGQETLAVVYVSEENNGKSSLSPSEQKPWIPLRTIEYLPGRQDYPAESIYQKGDLRRAILAEPELVAAIRKVIAGNRAHCKPAPGDKCAKWSELEARWNGPLSELAKTPVSRFREQIQAPTKAAMLNSRELVVTDAGTEKRFGGTIAEMVEIQKSLARAGVVTDRRSRLDFIGQAEVQWAQEEGRPLPESLATERP